MSITILLSSSITSPLCPISNDLVADENGNYHTTIFCFIDGYTGVATLTIVGDDGTEKTQSSYTNEYGAVGFYITGVLPDGERKKSYPILITIPNEEQRSFLTVNAA